MSREASFVLTKNRVFWSMWTDSHENIIEEFGLSPDGTHGVNVLRVEISPEDGDLSSDPSTWVFRLDQDITPKWYDPEADEKRTRAALSDWVAKRVIVNHSNRRLLNGKFSVYDSKVEAYDSKVEAHGSEVEARDSSKVEAHDSSAVIAYGSSTVTAFDSSTVKAYYSSKVEAYGSSEVKAYDSSTVRAFGSSTVKAYYSSKVEAYDSSVIRNYTGGSVSVHSPCAVAIRYEGDRAIPTTGGQ